jgi:Flp pilus assembly protein TadD
MAGGIALLTIVTCIAYWPSLGGDFILDDDYLITSNPLVKADDGLRRIWFTSESTDYWPVTNSSFWLEWRCWGANPVGYRVTNLVLHIAGCLLIWVVLNELPIPGGFIAAMLFAVHPVNVESAAWIAQRKNVLALVFFLLSIWSYLRAVSDPEHQEIASGRSAAPLRWAWYSISLLFFAAAMLSKGSVAVLPFILLMIAWWNRGIVKRSDLLHTAPFFAIAVVLTAVNVWFQTHGTEVVIRSATIGQRILGVGAVIWFYLYKALLPIDLAFIYPKWDIQPAEVRWLGPLLAAVSLTIVLLWYRRTAVGRAILMAWGCFCLALLPVMGFVDIGFMKHSLVADHYQHIALVPIVALVAAGWITWYRSVESTGRIVAAGTLWIVVGWLATLSWNRCELFGDPAALYEATLAKNPTSFLAHNNLGAVYLAHDRNDDAREQFEAAVQLVPDSAEYHYNLAKALAKLNRIEEAIDQNQQALRLKSDYCEAHNNLGVLLDNSGHSAEAVAHFEQALAKESGLADIHYNFGNALLHLGRFSEAASQYQNAVDLQPDYAEAWANLAATLAALHRESDARAAAEQALTLARTNHNSVLQQQIENWLSSQRQH